MAKSYQKIKAEMASAIEFVRAGGDSSVTVDGGLAFAAELAGHDDDHVIPWDDTPQPSHEAAVEVDSIAELWLAYQALGAYHGVKMGAKRFEKEATHERKHRKGARTAGFSTSRYGIITTNSDQTSFGWQLYHVPTRPTQPVTKLACAAMSAAPWNMSEGDQKMVELMGYTGPTDIGKRIFRSKNPLHTGLFLPEAFTSMEPNGRVPADMSLTERCTEVSQRAAAFVLARLSH